MKVRRTTLAGKTFLTGALLLPLAAMAQADRIQLELARCAAIVDINTRVACYDGLARPQQDKAQSKAPEAAKAETYGKPPARVEPKARPDDALLANVASLREVEPNKLQITLANGQVWQQTVGKAFFIRANDTVRIAASGWGRSFRLAVDGHPDFIQVIRLQ